MSSVGEYSEWFNKHEKEFPAIDFSPLRQVLAPSTYLAGALPIPSELGAGFHHAGPFNGDAERFSPASRYAQ